MTALMDVNLGMSTSRLYLVLKPIQIPRLALVGLCRYAQNESAAGRDLSTTASRRRHCTHWQVHIRYYTSAHVPVLSLELAPKRPGASHSSAGENWKWKRQTSPSHDAASFFFPRRANFTSPTPDPAPLVWASQLLFSHLLFVSVASLGPPLAAFEDDARPPPVH